MNDTDDSTIEEVEPLKDFELDHAFTTDERQYTEPTPEEVRAVLLRIQAKVAH